jgi:hypothetical protein
MSAACVSVCDEVRCLSDPTMLRYHAVAVFSGTKGVCVVSCASARSLFLATFAFLVAAMMVPSPSVAGGDFFDAEVLDFQPEAQGEYRITLRQLTPAYGSWQISSQPMTIHLRHNDWLMWRVPSDMASREIFNKAIELLGEQNLALTLHQIRNMVGRLHSHCG